MPQTATTKGPRGRELPDLSREQQLWDAGADVVAGLDEVGRGAWAGPLVVVAAALRTGDRHEALGEVRDSKQLSPARRRKLFDTVAQGCAGWAVGSASAIECDDLGMSEAQRLAAGRALQSLVIRPDAVLLDGRWDFVSPPAGSAPGHGGIEGPVRTVVGGDGRCVSLAAASILAKVWRDSHMVQQATQYPAYDFDRNKGYPCPRHRAALAAWGPSAIHRRSWAFMDHLPSSAVAGEPPVSQPRLVEHR